MKVHRFAIVAIAVVVVVAGGDLVFDQIFPGSIVPYTATLRNGVVTYNDGAPAALRAQDIAMATLIEIAYGLLLVAATIRYGVGRRRRSIPTP